MDCLLPYQKPTFIPRSSNGVISKNSYVGETLTREQIGANYPGIRNKTDTNLMRDYNSSIVNNGGLQFNDHNSRMTPSLSNNMINPVLTLIKPTEILLITPLPHENIESLRRSLPQPLASECQAILAPSELISIYSKLPNTSNAVPLHSANISPIIAVLK